MGACMLVRRSAIDQVGLLDEDFFLFSEETDWCFRFRQRGLAGRSSSPARNACTSAARRTAGGSIARTCAGTCGSSPSTAAARSAARAAASPRRRCGCAALLFRGERGTHVPRRRRPGSRPATCRRCSANEQHHAVPPARSARRRSCSRRIGRSRAPLASAVSAATLAWSLTLRLRRPRGRPSRSRPR